MKKNCVYISCEKRYSPLGKMLLTMKLSAFLFLLGILSVQANEIFSQTSLDIQMENASVEKVLELIQEQCDYDFIYDYEYVRDLETVNMDFHGATLDEVLYELLKNTSLDYRVEDEVIILLFPREIVRTGPDGNVIVSHQTPGQEVRGIKGKVTDEKGEPLPGASVIVKGTMYGVSTDKDGLYSLKISEPETTLVFSFVGMVTREIEVKDQLIINVTLKQEESKVDEVVVTGYFNKGKSGFAGTVASFKQADIQKVSTGNMLTTLASLDAGFRIHENNQAGSDPNVIPDFTIRGRGSFQNESTQPVFVVDGFQQTAEYVMDMDPNRIKSMNILKDAAATIFYGSRASNGVIVIETISPEEGKLKVTYDFRPTFTFADLTDYNLMNAREKLEFEKLAGVYIPDYESDLPKYQENYDARFREVQRGVDTYWLSQPLDDVAVSHSHSLYVEGGSNNVRYGIDADYKKTKGVMKASGNDKFNVGFRLIYRIPNKISVQNHISFTYKEAQNSPYGSFSTYARMNPYDTPFDEETGELLPYFPNYGGMNPLFNASLPFEDQNISQNIINQLSVDWHVVDNLRLKTNFQVNYGDLASSKYRSPFHSDYVSIGFFDGDWQYLPFSERGLMTVSDGKTLGLSGNVILNYDKQLGNHTLFFGLGGELLHNKSEQYGFSAQGFATDLYKDVGMAVQYVKGSKPTSSSSVSRSVGMFFTGNYIYDNRYFLDFSARYDGSSRFGANKKFAPFWAVGCGWNIHKENFFNSSGVLNELRLRYNYGITGNQAFSPYQALSMYQYKIDYTYHEVVPTLSLGYGNSDLQWQEQKSYNLGLDFVLKGSRIRGNLNYYKKQTTGLLADITVAPSVGFPDGTYKANLGEIQNTGFETSLNVIVLRNQKKDLEWGIGMQASHNRGKIQKISDALKTINDINNEEKKIPGAVYEEGESLTVLKAVKSLGIDPATGREMFLKKDGVSITGEWDADDKIVCGDTEPDLFGNISSNTWFKGWNLNMIFSYSIGGKVYNQTLVDKVENLDPRYNGDKRALEERWKAPGDLATYKSIADAGTTYISTRFVQKQKLLLQLKSLSLSYQFKSEKLSKYKIDVLRLSFYANDLFRISGIEMERGIDYPFARDFGLGLNVRF